MDPNQALLDARNAQARFVTAVTAGRSADAATAAEQLSDAFAALDE